MNILSSTPVLSDYQIISVLSLGVRCISVIDSEGIVVRTGGSRKYKQTTFIVRKIGYATYDIIDNTIKSGSILVSFPDITNSIHREKILKQWRSTEHIHGLIWDENDNSGIDIEDAYEELNRNIHSEIGKCLLLAKGSALENRLVSDIGLQLSEAIIKNTTFDYIIFDITDIGAPRIDDVFPGLIHDPLIECIYYLKYSIFQIDSIIEYIINDMYYNERLYKITGISTVDEYLNVKDTITILYESERNNNWIQWYKEASRINNRR